jgi:hypothetical protein
MAAAHEPTLAHDGLTFRALTAGRLHDISGTATYAHKPYRLVVVALPDRSGRHVFVLAAIVHSRATARDMRQYMHSLPHFDR